MLAVDGGVKWRFEFNVVRFVVPRNWEVYGRTSLIFGQFRNSYEYAPGVKSYLLNSHHGYVVAEGRAQPRCRTTLNLHQNPFRPTQLRTSAEGERRMASVSVHQHSSLHIHVLETGTDGLTAAVPHIRLHQRYGLHTQVVHQTDSSIEPVGLPVKCLM